MIADCNYVKTKNVRLLNVSVFICQNEENVFAHTKPFCFNLISPFPANGFSFTVFGRFSVDDRRKRIGKYAFSNDDETTSVGENILFRFGLVENGYF